MRPAEFVLVAFRIVVPALFCACALAQQTRQQTSDRIEYTVEVKVQGQLSAGEIRVSKLSWGATSLSTGRGNSSANADPGNPRPDRAEVAAKLDGDTVRIDLNLLFDNEKKQTAATYRLREGEIVEAPGLPEYGIAPFTLRVVIAKPLVEDPTPTDQMVEAGADVLVAHIGLTTKGSVGAMTLDQAAELVQKIADARKSVNPDVLIICHWGPIVEPEDAPYILQHTPGVHGFFGASSIERLQTEIAITRQVERPFDSSRVAIL